METVWLHRRRRLVSVLLLGCLGLAGLLTGCVAGRERIEFHLNPQVEAPLTGQPKASIVLGRFTDSRPDARWYVVLYNPQPANPLRPAEMVYVTSNSVAGIFRDGLADALGQNGFRTSGAAANASPDRPTATTEQRGFKANPVTAYRLSGDIQSAGCRNIQRLFATSLVKTWVTVRFDLVDQASGLTVWHDTYTGQNTRTNYSGGERLVAAFAEASDDTMRQLISDRNFRKYFEP
jgi:hypothetical protein